MSDIQFYNTTVAGTTSALSTGELAVNIADRSLMIGNSAGTAVRLNAFKWISSTRYDTTTSNISVPAGALFLEIIGCGGGGGGGGGASARSTALGSNINCSGGGGGGGGQGGRVIFPLSELGLTAGVSTIQVNIGAGGTAGGGSNSAAGDGGEGQWGNSTWVQKTGDSVEKAFVLFPGGFGGAAGARSSVAGSFNLPVEVFSYPFDGLLGEYHPSFPDDPIEYWGGEGRGGQRIGGNTGVSYLYGPNAFSGLYGGGGGGGGGGGYAFLSGGITYGVATTGGYPGTGGSFINTAINTSLTPGAPTGTTRTEASQGVQGNYGGAGGAGGGGGWTVSQAGRGGTGGPGGGGGGGGGGQRLNQAIASTAGPGGRGGSGYVILRWW